MRLDLLYIWIAAMAICFGIIGLACLLATGGDCMTLNISGNVTGRGFENLSYTGEALNVSILQNTLGCTWNISAVLP